MFAFFRSGPLSEIPHVMVAGDVHIVTVRRGLEGVVVPSKLYSILAAGRPVLAVAPSECDAARIVRESGCGIAADPDDPHAVAAGDSRASRRPARLAEMGRRARETAKKYARVKELRNFHRIMEEAAKERSEGVIWNNRKVLVTGGTSFIGSHLVDALVERGAKVRIVDDLTSGRLSNIEHHLKGGRVTFVEADLREPGVTRSAMNGIEVVFHLAADHGGRGYVDLHQAGPASNLFLDGLVFWEAVKAGVEKVVYASSGCVYPNYMQTDPIEGDLSPRRGRKAAARRGQYVRLGETDGGADAAGLSPRTQTRHRVLPLFHGVWSARR